MQKMTSRLPELRENILKAYEGGQTELDSEQADALREWIWEKAGQEENVLTSTGHLEHWLLGERFAGRLSDFGLDMINLDENRTRVTSSSKQRARASAESFLDGALGIPLSFNGDNSTGEEEFRYPDIITDDFLLRYYDHCPKYQNEVSVTYSLCSSFDLTLQIRNSYKAEVKEFESSNAFSKSISRMSSKAGVQLDNKEARLMWNICRCLWIV